MTLVRPPEFRCLATLDRGKAIVTVSGELDLSTAPELSRSLTEILDQHPDDLTVDLANLRFIDSSGLALLAYTSKSLRGHNGTLHLVGATPPVRRVLEIVGLDALLVA